MPRTGTRPHVWKVQGEIPHQQYCAFLQARAQANFREECFELTFEQFQTLWQDHWHQKGRGSADYCLTREDPEGAWTIDNVIVMPRVDHLRRQRLYKKLENEAIRNGKTFIRSKV
jgi:hypothetical protein